MQRVESRYLSLLVCVISVIKEPLPHSYYGVNGCYVLHMENGIQICTIILYPQGIRIKTNFVLFFNLTSDCQKASQFTF